MIFRIVRLCLLLSGGLGLIMALLLWGLKAPQPAAAFAPPDAGVAIPNASFHLWQINEIFSCPDGSIQFIEMTTTFTGQQFLLNHQLRATSGVQTHLFTFQNNSGAPTTNKSLLIATAGFGSLPGGITPDFTLPANFIFTTGSGSVELVNANTTPLSYNSGGLPLDGQTALGQSGAAAINTPTNFAGQTGSVRCPPVLRKTTATTANSGSRITYTLTITNNLIFSHTNVILTDTIPVSTSLAFADVAPVNNILTWNIGTMLPSSIISRTFAVTVNALGGSVIVNTKYGVRSDQSLAQGAQVQTSVNGNIYTYLPLILKNYNPPSEHAADLEFDFLTE